MRVEINGIVTSGSGNIVTSTQKNRFIKIEKELERKNNLKKVKNIWDNDKRT